MTKPQIHSVSDNEMKRIRRFAFWSVSITLALAVLVIIFIMTAGFWLKYISFQTEKSFFDPYADFALKNIVKLGDVDTQDYLQSIADKSARAMDLPLDFRIELHYVDSPKINALATVGGHVFLFSGLLEVMPNENALAMIIAHEVAHIKNRDPLISSGRMLAFAFLFSQISESGGRGESLSNFGGDLVLNAYSREQESRADMEALYALKAIYGHAGGAAQSFEILAREIMAENEEEFELISSHPAMHNRIEKIISVVKKKGWTSNALTPFPKYLLPMFGAD